MPRANNPAKTSNAKQGARTWRRLGKTANKPSTIFVRLELEGAGKNPTVAADGRSEWIMADGSQIGFHSGQKTMAVAGVVELSSLPPTTYSQDRQKTMAVPVISSIRRVLDLNEAIQLLFL